MKTNKTESQKKAAKKAEKKTLEKNLTEKLFEAVKSLGHDAEKIGEDLVLVSKFVAKKISKRIKSTDKKAPDAETSANTAAKPTKDKKTTKKVKASSNEERITPNTENPKTNVAKKAVTPAKKPAIKSSTKTDPDRGAKLTKAAPAKRSRGAAKGGDKEPVN